MVDSAGVIDVYSGDTGGTRNTIGYAKKHNVDIIMIVQKVRSKEATDFLTKC